MSEFEPVSPTYGLSDAVVAHRLRGGGERVRADLPGGYQLTLRTRELHGPLQAALAAPSPTGPARICTARFSAFTPLPAVSRILDAVTRYAPALPDARDAHPPREAVARLLTTGAPFQQPGEPGLFVQFGHAQAWLEGRRLSVTLGAPGSGLSLTLGGPWDAPSTARLTAAVLRELTDAGDLAGQVAALLPPGPWQVLSDQWHPAAALVLPSAPRWDPEDPLGRRFSRTLRALQTGLCADRPDWDFQELISVEGSAVALRVTAHERTVPRLVRTVVGTGRFVSGELGNTRTTFLPTDLPAFPCLAPALMSRPVTAPLNLYVAAEAERDIYGVKLDLGDWHYVLDAQAVFYGPGWYPFHEHVTRREKDPTAPLNDRMVPTGRTVPARVRISPDVEHRSWRNEYVVLTPVDRRVEARLQLYAGQDRGCALVRTVTLQIDLGTMRVTLPDQIPAGPLRHQAAIKGERILTLLAAARHERDHGASELRAVLAPWNRGDPLSTDT
ncbi:hypothetical protein OG819_58320 [Streptomyces sp. NBC_01549]|uniref:hypothetical protein n=1 Tax=Streptomyces TaxID=1883 RepID=UPI00225A6E04|nr:MULTISPECIES: hypothetical protein [Streptomyces]MCX4429391.1 hypothetical protein [Streptomyces mirabilis]MCX4598849.1 hypothetical protein [Streptomyces sp. NBC_01549]